MKLDSGNDEINVGNLYRIVRYFLGLNASCFPLDYS